MLFLLTYRLFLLDTQNPGCSVRQDWMPLDGAFSLMVKFAGLRLHPDCLIGWTKIRSVFSWFHALNERQSWGEIDCYKEASLPADRMLAKRKWNASKSRLKCKQIGNEIQAYWKWNTSKPETLGMDLINEYFGQAALSFFLCCTIRI